MSVNAEPKCACLDTDARTCYDLRYYGRSPVARGQAYAEHYYVMQPTLTAAELDDGECPCACHDEDAPEQRCANAGCGSGAWLTDDDECPECGWRPF